MIALQALRNAIDVHVYVYMYLHYARIIDAYVYDFRNRKNDDSVITIGSGTYQNNQVCPSNDLSVGWLVNLSVGLS